MLASNAKGGREMDEKCNDKVRDAYTGRMDEVRTLWNIYKKDPAAYDEDAGTWTCFDYVPKGTFEGQRRGYFRYQIRYGGPSEEFRFFVDETLDITRAEFWYLNGFDGASVRVTGRDLETWREIWDDFHGRDLLNVKMGEAGE
jgi:hypothetical protein